MPACTTPPTSLKARLCVAGREQLYAVLRVARRARTGAAASSSSRPSAAQADRAADHRAPAARERRCTTCAGSTRRGGDRARAGAALRSGAAVAGHRDHRQPCADAGLPRRPRARRRRARAALAARSGARSLPTASCCAVGGDAPSELATGILVNAAGLERRRSRADRGPGAGSDADAAVREGQLLRAERPRAVLAPDLPGARAGRPRRAPDARPRRPGAASARTSNGWMCRRPSASTTPSTRAAATGFYAAIRRYWPALAGRRAAARVQRRAAEAERPRRRRRATSCCKGRPTTVSPGW